MYCRSPPLSICHFNTEYNSQLARLPSAGSAGKIICNLWELNNPNNGSKATDDDIDTTNGFIRITDNHFQGNRNSETTVLIRFTTITQVTKEKACKKNGNSLAD